MTQSIQTSCPERADAQPALVAPPPLARLEQAGRVALFLDFDGTLVEIASDPQAIAPPDDLAARLESLADRFGGAVAVVSGRSIDNLRHYLGPVAVALAGSHGGHVVAPSGEVLRAAERLPDGASAALGDFAREHGLLHEAKPHGAALHYRHRPELAETATGFVRELALRHGLATKTGKCVIELVHPGVDKGGAVELLMGQATFAGALPVFIGDDVTDEDGFAACARLGGFGILVGHRPETVARYRLGTVEDVFRWLS